MESQDYEAYEKYARPPSRRASVPGGPGEIDERPRTSRGRRRNNTTNVPLQGPEGLSRYNETSNRKNVQGNEQFERPKTSHAHRSRGFDPAEYAAVAAKYSQISSAQVTTSKMEDPIERPTTSRGRRKDSLEMFISPSPEMPGEAGPLDSPLASPKSTPSPQPAPPRHPRSSRPKSAKGRPRPVYRKAQPDDQAAALMASGQPARPPSSASLNRFTPLPGIAPPSPREAGLAEVLSTDTRGLEAVEREIQKLDLNEAKYTGSKSGVGHDPAKLASETFPTSHDNTSHGASRKKAPQPAWPENGSKPKSILKGAKSESSSTPGISPSSKGILKQDKKKSPEATSKAGVTPDSPTKTLKTLTRKVILSKEPTAKEESLILAVKLPSGQRVLRKFSPSDRLESVLNFAEVAAQIDFTGYHFICDIPKRVFGNMKMTLRESGLKNRTVLHLLLPDDKGT